MTEERKKSESRFSRREFMYYALPSGLMVATMGVTNTLGVFGQDAEEETLERTPSNIEGPFYKKGAPKNNKLFQKGDPGMPLSVSGKIKDRHGTVLPKATVEIWQTNHHGEYDQNNYHYRATVPVKNDGSYKFETRLPGHYSIRTVQSYGERVQQKRPQHIHYRVSAPGQKTLITQLYFETDPFFEGDPDKTLDKDPFVKHRKLIRPVVLASKGTTFYTKCTFNIVL